MAQSAYTAKQLYENGLARFGMNFPDGVVGETNAVGVFAILNAGLTEFTLTHDWDFLLNGQQITTVAGTQVYSLSDDTETVASIGINDLSIELQVMQVHNKFRFGTAQGVPRFYFNTRTALTLCPTPAAAYTITVLYYQSIPAPNAVDQGAADLYTYLATIQYADLIPEWARPLAELYVAKNAALALKDKEAHGMITESIRQTRQTMDDNVRKATGTVPPQTRQDW